MFSSWKCYSSPSIKFTFKLEKIRRRGRYSQRLKPYYTFCNGWFKIRQECPPEQFCVIVKWLWAQIFRRRFVLQFVVYTTHHLNTDGNVNSSNKICFPLSYFKPTRKKMTRTKYSYLCLMHLFLKLVVYELVVSKENIQLP